MCRIHIQFFIDTFHVCPLMTCCEGTAVSARVRSRGSRRGNAEEDPALSALGRRDRPSNSRCSLMWTSGKSLTQTRFTSLILEVFVGHRGHQPFSPLPREAYLFSIQPGTSSIDSRFQSLSWRVLMPFSDLVMYSVTPFRSPSSGMFLAVGNSSW